MRSEGSSLLPHMRSRMFWNKRGHSGELIPGILVELAWLLLLAVVFCDALRADELWIGPRDVIEGARNIRSPEPFGVEIAEALPNEMSAKWAELQSRILSEGETLSACRTGSSNCPAAARDFLQIIELGRQNHGRAQFGMINRAVNLSIKPTSDWTLYGVSDFWSAPIATLRAGAGDCEDYAIVKYVALRELGVASDDLRFLIVRDIKRKTDHAVVAVRLGEEWLILDNRTLIMVSINDAAHYYPLFALDYRGVRVVEFRSTVALLR
jgi:predicted transglutaminase-like cysteine proteinase